MQFSVPSYRQASPKWPSWLPFMAGSMLTFSLFYFGVARPASDEMASLKRQLEAMERSVAMVAGHKGSVDETNHLLSMLGQQQAYAAGARQTIADIKKLNAELIGESLRVEEALLAVDQLASIKDLVIANSDRTSEAAEALDASEELQSRLVDSAETSEAALQAGIDLLAIQNELMRNADRTEPAKANLEQLVAIRDVLDDEASSIELAEGRIAELVSLKDAVLAGTDDMKASIETLQLTRELEDRYREASQSFREMRLWMIEMSALQPLFTKVQASLQPLTDLANLERMQPHQLREFVKTFTQSKTRLAGLPATGVSDGNSIATDGSRSSQVE